MTAKIRKNSELSSLSYQAYLTTGKQDRYKQAIIRELSKAPRTRRELVHLVHAGSPSNITAPIKALENEGVIYRCGVVQDQVTGREVTQYALVAAQEPGAQTENPCITIRFSGGISAHPDQEDPFNGNQNKPL